MASKFEIVLAATIDKTQTRQKVEKVIKEVESSMKGITLKLDDKGVKEVTKSMNGLTNATKDATKHTQDLTDKISKFSSWQIVGDVIHGVKDAMGQMVTNVIELDDALVEFNKVTDVTPDQLKEITNEAYDLGEQMSRTGKEAIIAATNFSKAGYKESSMELAKTALLYQNIADEQVSAADATNLIVSQMKAFDIKAEDSIKIIDQINEVSNNFAVSSAQLATAIPKVSATLAQAGNTMSETTALITAGSEVMVGQSSRVARGLRSITLNLQGMDDEGNQNMELVAKMEKDFNKLGLTLQGTDGQLKSTFQIFSELAEVYPKLDQNTKNYYSALIGGRVLPRRIVICV